MRNLASNSSGLANDKTRMNLFNRHVPLPGGDEFDEG